MTEKVATKSWRTNDLMTAAVLRCHGLSADRIVYDSDARSVYFEYEETAALLTVAVNLGLGRCRVEPKEYNNYYVGLKDEMFDFMREEGVYPRSRG